MFHDLKGKLTVKVCVKLTVNVCGGGLVSQSCVTPCPACRPPGSSVHGILQARILSGWPCPSPGNLPDPGIEPRSPALQVVSLPPEPPRNPLTVNREEERRGEQKEGKEGKERGREGNLRRARSLARELECE